MNFFEKYRLYISILGGAFLCILVLFLWSVNEKKRVRSLEEKVRVTSKLVAQQFREVLTQNVNQVENFKHSLEITKGNYFNYWN